MAANALAAATGPRITGTATLVMSVLVGAAWTTDASAVRPSSAPVVEGELVIDGERVETALLRGMGEGRQSLHREWSAIPFPVTSRQMDAEPHRLAA